MSLTAGSHILGYRFPLYVWWVKGIFIYNVWMYLISAAEVKVHTRTCMSNLIVIVIFNHIGERTDFGSEVGSLAGSEDSGTVNYQNTQPINTPPSKNMPRDVIEE